MNKVQIRQLVNTEVPLGEYEFGGWVKTHRQSKNVSFIELTDGTSIKGLQLVVEPTLDSYSAIAAEITTGSSISVKGELKESPAKGQRYELAVSDIELVGGADSESYILQKKGHTLEFLREHLHLRPRSNTHGAVFRIRSVASMAIHEFFQSRGFVYVHTPIITASDCEGAGEMFKVTTLDLENPPRVDGKVNYEEDFFKAEASLTVSGQLQAECFALALSNVYTFGPTFRAENSNTTRHLSEFWMIEPEMAFCDLVGNMEIGEAFIKFVLQYVMDRCGEELEFCDKWYAKDDELVKTLEGVVNASFEVIEYGDAIKILEASGESFEFPVHWGVDLQAEHEKYLTDKHVGGPVFVVNYPSKVKMFYMRANEDGETVAAMDMLVPRLGEIIGGSQREEREDVLLQKISEKGLDPEEYEWFLELRRYGTVPHAGFGLGFERLLMYMTAMQNIRDVIPFPRYPGHAKF